MSRFTAAQILATANLEGCQHREELRAFADLLAEREQGEDGKVTVLPDGSAFAVASYPLPKNHWLTAPRVYEVGRDDDVPPPALSNEQRNAVKVAVQWAIRGATNCGKLDDYDPDALVQNAVYALCGPYGTPNAAPSSGQPVEVTGEGETPRTDKFYDEVSDRESHDDGSDPKWALPTKWSYEAILDLVDFARTLERELAELVKWRNAINEISNLAEQRAEQAEAEVTRMRDLVTKCRPFIDNPKETAAILTEIDGRKI